MAVEKLKTTGQLRDFLSDTILDVKNGVMDLDKAKTITKLSAQVNESFYSEIKVQRAAIEAGQAAHEFSRLTIGEVNTAPEAA